MPDAKHDAVSKFTTQQKVFCDKITVKLIATDLLFKLEPLLDGTCTISRHEIATKSSMNPSSSLKKVEHNRLIFSLEKCRKSFRKSLYKVLAKFSTCKKFKQFQRGNRCKTYVCWMITLLAFLMH